MEIQHYGASSVQVERRLAEVVASLMEHVPAPRGAAVERMFGFLGAAPRDRQGLGHRVEPAPH
jgi:uncharacterized membrane protein